MKLQPDKFDVPSISGYGPGWVGVGAEKITASVVIGSKGQRLDWPCASFADLTAAHFAQLAGLDAELVIFGSGERLRFPQPAWLQPLIARRIGLETMDTQAACRTYNILAGEGRSVIAALLLEQPG
ncbi:Mth938-like domain-containing protein [Variovorax terrae]|uniref:Mth938-like domain-containing protein n=1 Tax=Variovorax terrae TaxID=2923278 RepID=A0A9X1VXG5_9BURK|nr:Mth938-like domain-containing protein [Variovorax terrae]MCJ0763772.1 Mth938-like domain-containing protein [Variovorax terrae]